MWVADWTVGLSFGFSLEEISLLELELMLAFELERDLDRAAGLEVELELECELGELVIELTDFDKVARDLGELVEE